MAVIDLVLELLKDGKWHSIEEIRRKTNLGEHSLRVIIDFLLNFNFIEVREKGIEVKATPDLLKIIKLQV